MTIRSAGRLAPERISSSLPKVFVVALVACLALFAQATVAQQLSLGATERESAAAFRYQIGRRITFVCPAIRPPADIAVWGTGVYTFDSSVCLAAIHAGLLRAGEAAPVTFTMGPGAAAFAGSDSNGVTSAGYGPYDSSFEFDQSGEPGRIDGMTKMRVPAGFTAPVTVVCPLLGDFPQPLWGTDIYTEDSSICAAAAHSGVIPLNSGGPVTVTAGGPQRSFEGSKRYGVTSQAYTEWPVSFTVAATGPLSAITMSAPTGTITPITLATPDRLPSLATGEPTTAGNVAAAAAAARFGPPPERQIHLEGFTGVGESAAVAPRTIDLPGFAGTGGFAIVPAQTLTLPGWTGTGPPARINLRTPAIGGLPGDTIPAPRTITLPGFNAAGAANPIAPRSIGVAGFTGTGSFALVPPRTIELAGWTATGAIP